MSCGHHKGPRRGQMDLAVAQIHPRSDQPGPICPGAQRKTSWLRESAQIWTRNESIRGPETGQTMLPPVSVRQ